MSFNMKYHNLDVVVRNLDIFKKRYVMIRSIKVNQKRGIYLVRDTFDNENKVLKFIISSSINDEQRTIFRFFMNCTHQNFCRINETFEIGLFFVLVMDHVEGDTMCSYFEMNHKRVDYYRILFDLIFSLDYLHNNKIIHGDIKPNNIIIKPDGVPVIIDYDLSRFVDGNRFTKRIFGTKFFMPPELIIENKFSTKSDIWSLGMTLYVCIMKTYMPDILENISSIDDNGMMGSMGTAGYQKLDRDRDIIYYVNQTARNVLGSIANNHKKIRNIYGKLFTNTVSIMLVEEDILRPSSEQLSNIIQKSKYFLILYNKDVGPDRVRHGIKLNERTYKDDFQDDDSIGDIYQNSRNSDNQIYYVSNKFQEKQSVIGSCAHNSLSDNPLNSNELLDMIPINELNEQMRTSKILRE